MDSNEKKRFDAWVLTHTAKPLDQSAEKLIFTLWKDNYELLSKVIKLEAEVGQLTRAFREARYLPRAFIAAKG